jgi:3-deoxy-D-manno-octulosonic-acid transferase
MRIASLFHPKAKQWVKGRAHFFSSLPDVTDKEVYWFHCASLGEFDQGLPVINLIKEKYPSVFIVVTFFSPSGYLHYHKRSHKADFVCYLPLDTPSNAKKFIQHFNPEKAFFVKYEFWANFIFQAQKNSTKIYSICAIFRKDQIYFNKKHTFFKSILEAFDYFFVQNSLSAELLDSISIYNHKIIGDTRFDRVIENKNNLKKNEKIENFLKNEKAFIIGSSWTVDEDLIIPFINDGKINHPVIIAPHDISENHILQICKKLKVPFVRYSELEHKIPSCDERILILDSIGQLASAYSYGSHAYIGGGFTGSLHNILEPAVFGLPVIFGPKHTRFPEAEMFISKGIGFSIKDENEFITILKQIESTSSELKEKIIEVVSQNAGASKKIIDKLSHFKNEL